MPVPTQASDIQPAKVAAGRPIPRLSIAQLAELLDGVYEGHTEEQPWLEMLKRIRCHMKGTWTALMLRPATSVNPAWIVTAGGPMSLASESPLALGNDVPPNGPYRDLPPGAVVVVEKAGILGATLHVIGADILIGDGLRVRLRIARTAKGGAFSEHEKSYVEMIVPHLSRSMRACDFEHNSRQEIQVLNRIVDNLALGIVILDESGDVIRTNECAENLLKSGKGVRLVRGRLQCEGQMDERRLNGAIKTALGRRAEGGPGVSNAVIAFKPEGGEWLSILVRQIAPSPLATGPKAPALALFIRSPRRDYDVPNKVVKELFGLTATEAVLALEMANGYTMDEASESMGIRRNTARTHLRSIFAKVGVRRQTALMRVIINSVATMV